MVAGGRDAGPQSAEDREDGMGERPCKVTCGMAREASVKGREIRDSRKRLRAVASLRPINRRSGQNRIRAVRFLKAWLDPALLCSP